MDGSSSGASNVDNKEGLPPGFPTNWDWRHQNGGLLSSVKNQKDCNMCWAVTVAEAVGAAVNIERQHHVQLSSQELLDCCKEEESNCYSYGLKKAFEWIKENGIREEKEYPFTASKGCCIHKPEEEKLNAIRIKDVVTVNHEDEVALLNAVKRQPVAGGIRMTREFAKLKWEIYECSGNYFYTAPNKIAKHAILIVGFGHDEEENKSFWIIKNSYGESWGLNGYGRIARASSIPEGRKYLISPTYYPIF